MLSRRAFVSGGLLATGAVAGGVGIYEGVLPGRPRLQALLVRE